MAAVGLGDLNQARTYAAEGVALAKDLGRRRELAAALTALAQLHRIEHDVDQAEPLYQHALSISRELDDHESAAIGLLNLAMVSIEREKPLQAREMLDDALSIEKNIGSKQVGQSALDVTAGLCALHGCWEDAARFFGAAEAQAERAGLRRDAVDDAFLGRMMARAHSALHPSVFDARTADGRALGYEDALRLARDWVSAAQGIPRTH
jgi:tetratricopeptide (TPR) repeat protein